MRHPVRLSEDRLSALAGDAAEPAATIPVQSKMTLDQATRVDPDQFAQERQLATETGLPPEVIRTNPGEFARQIKVRDTDTSGFGPALQQLMQDPEYAALVHDDLDNLNATEQELDVGGALSKSRDLLHSMILDIGTSAAGLAQEYYETPRMGIGPIGIPVPGMERRAEAEFFARIAESGKSRSEELMPKFESQIANAAAGGVKSFASFMTLMALTKGNALVPMAMQSKGLSYVDARLKGVEAGEASIYSDWQGAVEYLTEKIPFDALMKSWGKDTFVKTLRNQLATEMPGEQIATVLQDLADWVVLPENEEKSFMDYLNERPNAALNTAVATLVGTSLQTTTMHAASKVIERNDQINKQAYSDAEKLVASRVDQDRLDRLITLAQDSKVHQRAADVYKKFLDGAGSDQSVFIPLDVINDLIKQGMYIPPEMRDATIGGDVEIPMGQFMPFAGNPENKEAMAALRPHMKMGLDRLTATEIEQGGDSTVRRLLERANISAQAKTEADQYWQKVVDELIATNRMTASEAKSAADIYPAMAAVAAERYGITVKEVLDTFKMKIVGPGTTAPDAQVIEQAQETGYQGQNVEEARQWVRALAKYGPEGMTLEARMARAREQGFDVDNVLHHGTHQQPDAFNTGRAGMVFFSENEDFSSSFGNDVAQYYVKPGNMLDMAGNPDHLKLVVDMFNKRGGWEKNAKDAGGYETLEAWLKDTSGEGRDSFLFDPRYDNQWEILDDPETDVLSDIAGMGFDSFRFVDSDGESVTVAVMDPTRIRSVNAAFNEDDVNSPDVLAQESQKFREWFGDSKVVDENGDPLVVYHGTAGDFTEFDMSQGGMVYGEPDSRGVMYFSGSPKRPWSASDDAARVQGGESIPAPNGDSDGTFTGANIMPVYLKITNPMVIDGYRATAEDISKAKSEGHDGIIVTKGESDDGTSDYIIFEPTQIKSAIGNNGNFDPNNPSILAQEATADPFAYFDGEDVDSAVRSAKNFKSREAIVFMSPQEFLSLAEEGFDNEKAERVSRYGKFSSLPSLSYDMKYGVAKVDGHEGRHRARELIKRGVTRMPVSIKGPIRFDQQSNPSSFDYVDQYPKLLVGEGDKQTSILFPVKQGQSGVVGAPSILAQEAIARVDEQSRKRRSMVQELLTCMRSN